MILERSEESSMSLATCQEPQRRNTLGDNNRRSPPPRASSLPVSLSLTKQPTPEGDSQLHDGDIDEEEPRPHLLVDNDQPQDDTEEDVNYCLSPEDIFPPHDTSYFPPRHPDAPPSLQRYLWQPTYTVHPLHTNSIVHLYRVAQRTWMTAKSTRPWRWRTRFHLGPESLPVNAIPLTQLCLRSASEFAVKRASTGLRVLERLARHIAKLTVPVYDRCEWPGMMTAAGEEVVPVQPRGDPAFDPVLGNIWCASNGWILAVTNPHIVFAEERVCGRLEKRFLHCRG